MDTIYVMDRLVHKPIKLSIQDKNTLKHGDKVIYLDQQTNKNQVGVYYGHEMATERSCEFVGKLQGDKEERFNAYQKQALEFFPLFKKEFKHRFEGSIPVTGRATLNGDIVYFYFYSETRYEFGTFLREFKEKIGKNFFLYQVGARDMVRLSPATDDIVGCNGHSLCCKNGRELPSIELENIALQNLEGRDIEKLKGRCGKLKCSLVYESALYKEEGANFPAKGEEVEVHGKCGRCSSFNIMTGEIIARSNEGEIMKFNRDEYQEEKKKKSNRAPSPTPAPQV